ncbi:MAG TPA: ABC transporter permease subunit, partial [Thermoanaerobaculia bacterium]|nr:ABC transporter permease subunit [Thermoanaerobaculia bacterium]
RELLRKDLAELFASRAYWLLLLAAGLLAGQAFITAVNAYAEASGIGGGAAALSQGLSPLDGILVPTASAYDLAITLLFPFVAIRLIASEKSSGALKLLLQWPVTMGQQLAAKVVTLLIAWLLALLPFAIALVLWCAYGGHLDTRETLNLLAGYTLRFLLTSSLALAAAAMMPGAANAAVVVLGFTIGTWALDFVAAGRGGWLQRLASFTPTATLRTFERGLFRVDVALILILLALFFVVLTGIALDLGRTTRARITRSAIAAAIIAIAIVGAAQIRTSFDVSENRRNSFAPADEATLAQIRDPLTITVFMAAEDPRMFDFENNVLVKLRRAVPRLEERYPFAGRSGLFDNDDRYGEVHYTLRGKTAVSRSTTEEIVLETIDGLAGLRVPAHAAPTYPGYPLAKRPRFAAVAFYVAWPLLTFAAWLTSRRAPRSRRTG